MIYYKSHVSCHLCLDFFKKEMCFKSEEQRLKNNKTSHNPYRYKRVSQSKAILAMMFYQSGRSRGKIVWQFYTGSV